MNRKSSFKQKASKPSVFKSLRNNAREAAEYISGIPYTPKYDKDIEVRTPGRGVNGESSN
jgi:hypothetical protein